MRIGIIGAGWLGGTVGRQWVRAGHEVLFSSRHPERLKSLAEDLGSRASVGTVAAAAAFGPVVLIATPYEAMAAIGRDHQEALRGRIVLDATNPGASGRFARDAATDGVGPTSARLLLGTRLVRAFSAVDATAIEASAKGRGVRLAVPLAGDTGRQSTPRSSSYATRDVTHWWSETSQRPGASSVRGRAFARTQTCQACAAFWGLGTTPDAAHYLAM